VHGWIYFLFMHEKRVMVRVEPECGVDMKLGLGLSRCVDMKLGFRASHVPLVAPIHAEKEKTPQIRIY
jgi:hypothetical protein